MKICFLYNEKNFSVCPLTTHIELKNVENKINEKKIKNCIYNVLNFYKKINKKIKIVILGLNPMLVQTLTKML